MIIKYVKIKTNDQIIFRRKGKRKKIKTKGLKNKLKKRVFEDSSIL